MHRTNSRTHDAPDHAKKLLAGSHSAEMLKAASRHVSPVFWIVRNVDGIETVLNSGTIFLVDVGHGPFVVTANHVYEGNLAAKAEHPLVESVVLPMSNGGVRHTSLRTPRARRGICGGSRPLS